METRLASRYQNVGREADAVGFGAQGYDDDPMELSENIRLKDEHRPSGKSAGSRGFMMNRDGRSSARRKRAGQPVDRRVR